VPLLSGIYASCRGEADCPTGSVYFLTIDLRQLTFFQDAERARFVVEKAEQERQAQIIRAEGEAEAAAVISKALDKAGEAFVAFRKIEAAKAIVHSLSSNPNVTYVPSSGGNVLLNVPTGQPRTA
jgi:regulator of protease activity HflC (stomatin/prohibitin superfamily)